MARWDQESYRYIGHDALWLDAVRRYCGADVQRWYNAAVTAPPGLVFGLSEDARALPLLVPA